MHETYQKILMLVRRAARLARSAGIPNLLQPGSVKEMIIANHLGHVLIPTKRQPDAHAPDDPSRFYEYLSCKEGGSGQIDRMFKAPADKREKSLERINRNAKIYFAVFYLHDQTEVKIIYELEPDVVVREANRQLDRSRNAISHIGFTEGWARDNGKIAYRDEAAERASGRAED